MPTLSMRLEGCKIVTEGTKAIKNLCLEDVYIPRKPGFPFSGNFPLPESRKEAGMMGFSSGWTKELSFVI
ncbi:hypothetical protein L2E82_49777 [Cichorium intybus]|uniref:Uncharacterized protein n=1 Tax=Cichorium intybus TaxID=13427 RepID=A0ACB8Z1G1_CICIN|nr:hypothetical protein L2E82_49777 [Cichorium intybus]